MHAHVMFRSNISTFPKIVLSDSSMRHLLAFYLNYKETFRRKFADVHFVPVYEGEPTVVIANCEFWWIGGRGGGTSQG
jgi:hypothetical protein